MNSIWIGYDPREDAAFAVARSSVKRHLNPLPSVGVYGLVLADLQRRGLYTRPIEMRPSALDKPIMWDTISDASMSTEHANARFLVPHLARLNARVKFKAIADKEERYVEGVAGWALFMDGDMLVRKSLRDLFRNLDNKKAVYCVHHKHEPTATTKMDGQVQTSYSRKNWSSFILFNCNHPSIRKLTPSMVNRLPGRDLHRLCFIDDDNEIGELGPEMNFLVGHSDPSIDPTVVHFTDGLPNMDGYEDVAFADEWRAARDQWAA